MQPDQDGSVGIERRRSPIAGDRAAVGSRRRALDRLRGAFRAGLRAPVLITGEPGAGKSWLVRRHVEGLPAGWRSAEAELSSGLDGVEMLRLIGDPLGLEMPDRLGAARLRLGAALRDEASDGRSWVLILDEVQDATGGAWEEIRVLANQLGRPGGFGGLIVLGRTEVVRQLSARGRAGWDSRLGLHIHLPPLDLDEARALLRPESRLTEAELETLHRDAMGNPRAMLRLAAARGRAAHPAPVERPDAGRRIPPPPTAHPLPAASSRPAERPGEDAPRPTAEAPAPPAEGLAPRSPSLIPARPPIRFEEGLVEVGWEGDLEAEATRVEASTQEPGSPSPPEGRADEELVEDRYAALQAWAEWSRNRERSAAAGPDPSAVGLAAGGGDPGEPSADESSHADHGPMPASSLRAEPPQDFAPYSQLFSRLRQSL